jgi:hypothetical protein
MIRWPPVAVVDLIGVRRIPGMGRRLKRIPDFQMTANSARALEPRSNLHSNLAPARCLKCAGVYLPRKWLFSFADILGQPIMPREYPRGRGRPRAHCSSAAHRSHSTRGAVTSVSRAASRAVLHQRITRSSSAPAPKPPAIVVGHNATCRRLEGTSSAVSGASLRRFEKRGPRR